MRQIVSGLLTDKHLCIVAELAPGSIWFTASKPVVISVNSVVTDVAIFISGVGMLNVARLETIPSVANEPYKTFVSSQAGGSESYSLLHGGVISTKIEKKPEFQMTLMNPFDIKEIRLYNREGKYSHRALRIRIEIWNNKKQVAMLENDSYSNVFFRTRDLVRKLEYALECTNSLGNNNLYKYGIENLNIFVESFFSILLLQDEVCDTALTFARRSKHKLIHTLYALSQTETSNISCKNLSDLCDFFLMKTNFMEFYNADDKASAVSIEYNRSEQYDLCLSRSIFDFKAGYPVLNAQIYDFECAIPSLELMESYEHDLRSLSRVIDVGEINLTSHGFSLGSMEEKRLEFIKSIDVTIDCLNKLGKKAALCYGTLLGAYREESFIPHDDDVDLIVEYKCSEEERITVVDSLMKELQELGCIIRRDSQIFLLKIVPPGCKIEIDVAPCFVHEEDEENTSCDLYMEPGKIKRVPRELLIPFSGRVKLYDKIYDAPKDIEGFLLTRYGVLWSKPIKYGAFSWLSAAEEEKHRR